MSCFFRNQRLSMYLERKIKNASTDNDVAFFCIDRSVFLINACFDVVHCASFIGCVVCDDVVENKKNA